jgi:serine/threonine protein kinase
MRRGSPCSASARSTSLEASYFKSLRVAGPQACVLLSLFRTTDVGGGTNVSEPSLRTIITDIHRGPYDLRVEAVLESSLSSGRPSREQVARALGVSTRTLQRRLAENGTTFDGVVRQVRERLALELLSRHDLRLEDVATEIGYQDESAFKRAFTTWTGITPAAHRRSTITGTRVYDGARPGHCDIDWPIPVGLAARWAPGESGKRLFSSGDIPPEFAYLPEAIGSMFSEISVSELLRWPRMVPALDFRTMERTYYLALDLVESYTLEQLKAICRRRGCNLPPSVVCHIIARVADALAYAHDLADATGRSLGIVHGDVNPSNIIISPAGSVKLLDFGLARRSVPWERIPIGTPTNYASPEQAAFLPVDRRSDIYSLGMVFCACLVPEASVNGNQESSDGSRIRAPLHLLSGIDTSLERIVMKMLAASPSDRYRDCTEVAAALKPIVMRLGGGHTELRRFLTTVMLETAQQSPGSVTVDEPTPGVVIYKMAGFLDGSLVPRFEQAAAPYVQRRQRVDLFFDCTTMSGNTPDFRRQMTHWHNTVKLDVTSHQVLAVSKRIAMTVSVVNMNTDGLFGSHSDCDSFRAAIQTAMRRRRR